MLTREVARPITAEDVKSKLELLVFRYRQSRKEAQLLRQEVQQFKVEKENLQKELGSLREQVKNLKLAQALAGSGDQDNRQLRQSVVEYIREIDRCLALINRD